MKIRLLFVVVAMLTLSGMDCQGTAAGFVGPVSTGCGSQVTSNGVTFTVPCGWYQTNQFTPNAAAIYEGAFLNQNNQNVRLTFAFFPNDPNGGGSGLMQSGTEVSDPTDFVNAFGIAGQRGSLSADPVYGFIAGFEFDNGLLLGLYTFGRDSDTSLTESALVIMANSVRLTTP